MAISCRQMLKNKMNCIRREWSLYRSCIGLRLKVLRDILHTVVFPKGTVKETSVITSAGFVSFEPFFCDEFMYCMVPNTANVRL